MAANKEQVCHGKGPEVAWRRRYCKRMRPALVKRKVTNKKSRSIVDDLPVLQSYHHGLRQFVCSVRRPGHEGPQMDQIQMDPKYGRFKKEKRISGDQIPLPFVVNQKETLEEYGTDVVQVKAPNEALAKRQYTGHVHFAAGRTWRCQPKAMLVCRGKGIRISALEKTSWDPRIHVLFQRCAWVDRPIGIKIAELFVIDEEERMGLQDEFMYSADQLDAQTHNDLRRSCTMPMVL